MTDIEASVGAAERGEFLRAAWKAMVLERTQASLFVFVDECSTNTSLAPLYAWSPKGQRAHCKVPRNYGPNVTLLASMTHEGMGPCLAVEGATTRVVFETYIEQMLGPALRPGQMVVMDNLSSHKGERIRELIEERDCALLYLPPYSGLQWGWPDKLALWDGTPGEERHLPGRLRKEHPCALSDGMVQYHCKALYSPDLNLIEKAFSKIKGTMRKAGACAREALIEAMGRAL